MNYDEFKVGRVYMAVPSLEGADRRIIVVCGREGRRIQCAWVDDMTIEHADNQMTGREVIVAHYKGEQYCISSALPIESYSPVEVADILRRGRAKA